MNLKWDDVKLFLAVYEQGSLSGAARVLKLGQPTLSRRIAQLEEVVGEALFERQNAGTTLTATGLKLLPAALGMAEWASAAELSLGRQTHLPEGKVRITAPPGIAYELVAPLAVKVRRDFPAIQLEVLSTIETLNLARGDADLALRAERPTDADLICVDEITSPMRVYVSRDYARTLPREPKLSDLDWIAWSTHYDAMSVNQELRAIIPDFTPAFTSDDYNVQVAACKAGVGAMILPRALHHYVGLGELKALQELPIDLGPSAIGMLYLVCHKRQRHLPKVERVIRAISEEFAAVREDMRSRLRAIKQPQRS